MKKLIALGVSLGAFAFNANATLTSYTGAGGVGLVYNSVTNETATKDANLFKTLFDSDPSLVSKIVSVTPIYNDPAPDVGPQAIGDGGAIDDFDTETGGLSWWGALAFTSYLNSINYAGSSKWTLGMADYFHTNTDIFINEKTRPYWTASQHTAFQDYAYIYYSLLPPGINNRAYKGSLFYAWAVSPGQVAAVPLPGAAWLMLSALFGLLGFNRRKA